MIGVVIPVYAATFAILRTALASLASFERHSGPHARLYVVRNGGTYPASRLAESCDVLIDLPLNVGYPAAVNIGIKTAAADGCDHFVVGSADVFLPPPASLAPPAPTPSGHAALAPVAPTSSLQPLMSHGLRAAVEAGFEHTCDHPGLCPFWGGLFAFPKAMSDRIGLLDESYGRCADAEYACRAAACGWSIGRGDLTVEHRHPSAANNAADPEGGEFAFQVMRLRERFGDMCLFQLGARP